jgi:NAD-dependent SIR2 family protein deacetylase
MTTEGIGHEDEFRRAAEAVRQAKTLLITAGAGMGVDSGLPDFRGDKGFWQAYPPYERLGLSFVEAANPAHFEQDPFFGWGFYGHRANLYRETVPHRGFEILRELIDRFALDWFVVTSNVDGQFQKAGYDDEKVLEVHGTIHYLQCTRPCSLAIWHNEVEIAVDLATMRSRSVPKCIRCGGVARPNILMFGDVSWIDQRTRLQEARFREFLEERSGKGLVVVEMGAGTAIPTIRSLGERLTSRNGGTLIRINPREFRVDEPQISLPYGALDGLEGLEAALQR